MNNINDEKFWQLYNEERDKLSSLPNADDDFIAYQAALEKYSSKENI